MAQTSGFFDAEESLSGEYDREYIAEQWANYFSLFIGNGVFASPSNQLQVVENSGMTVTVKAGWGWINGYWYHNDSDLGLTIPANQTASAVTDGIFLRFDSSERKITVEVEVGRTTVNRTAPYYELKLAEVEVAAGATTIAGEDITDTRIDGDVCGLVAGLIEVIDAQDFYDQLTSAFNIWFDHMKDQLSTDAAGNLQLEIDNLQDQIDAIQPLTNQEIDLVLTTLFYPPNGATVTPINSVPVWLKCGCIFNLEFDEMSQVLEDTIMLDKLINHKNAYTYMFRSTDFTTDICANETAMTDIGENNSCRDYLFTSPTWHAALVDSQYAEYITTRPAVGTTVNPTNDAKTWLECISEFNSEYSTLSDILADEDTFIDLMMDDNALDYLTRSQDFVAEIFSNETAMGYIGSNADCAEKLLGINEWKTLICNSTYFESVLNKKVPVMTSYTDPSGEVSANVSHTSYPAWKAFTGTLQPLGWYANAAIPCWIQYEFEDPVRVVRLKLSNCCYNNDTWLNYGVKDFKIQYSDDNVNFFDVYEGVAIKGTANIDTNQIIILDLPSEGHKIWRLLALSNHGNTASNISISMLQFYGIE